VIILSQLLGSYKRKRRLSKLAKAVIRECAREEGNNVYSTFFEVSRLCGDHYTIKQVGRYLRRVKKRRGRGDSS